MVGGRRRVLGYGGSACGLRPLDGHTTQLRFPFCTCRSGSRQFGRCSGGNLCCGQSALFRLDALAQRRFCEAFSAGALGDRNLCSGFLLSTPTHFLRHPFLFSRPRQGRRLCGLFDPQLLGSPVGGKGLGDDPCASHAAQLRFPLHARCDSSRKLGSRTLPGLCRGDGDVLSFDARLQARVRAALGLRLRGDSSLRHGIGRGAIARLPSRMPLLQLAPLRCGKVLGCLCGFRRTLPGAGVLACKLPAFLLGFHQSGQQLAQDLAPHSGQDSGSPGEAAYRRPGVGRR